MPVGDGAPSSNPSRVANLVKKKLREEALHEKYNETEAFLKKAREQLESGEAPRNPEWLELGLRAALMGDARKIIESFYNDRQLFKDDEPPRDLETRYGQRAIHVTTLFGRVCIKRLYYHHKPSRTGRSPLDEKLGLEGKYSPALARLVCRAASMAPSFEQGAGDMHAFTGLEVDARQFGRVAKAIAPGLKAALATITNPPATAKPAGAIPVLYVETDVTGTPMRKSELAGRKGRQKDGSSKTREAKLGCVFTQTRTDGENKPIRDPASTSYVGTFDGCRDIAVLLHQEALRRGLGRAQKVVFIGDGAAWIWNNCESTFPGAVQILDYYHASEYVVDIAKAIHIDDGQQATALQKRWRKRMKETSPKKLIAEARILLGKHPGWDTCRRALIEEKISYLESHASRTEYGEYRAKGYFIGSGVIEAGCKTVVGSRLKQSGMFWSKRGAGNILDMRCLFLGPDFERVWERRIELKIEQKRKARRWNPQDQADAA